MGTHRGFDLAAELALTGGATVRPRTRPGRQAAALAAMQPLYGTEQAVADFLYS
ncbi:hypothetical protein [Micromonospora lupini]|uniref:hypothetical protein n=1 Tax=Micromonospora lupini TaxID=285679 RepID=UPI0031DC3330